MMETERLIIRPLTINDAYEVFEWVSDPIVNRYMPYPLHVNIKQTQDWISNLGDSNEFCFCLKDTRKLVGAGSIKYQAEYEAYELGYSLNKNFWGMGYATEAAKAMVQWAYRNKGAHDFFARYANENKASGNVILKCGFQFEKYGQYSKCDGSEIFAASYYKLHLD